MTTEKETRDEMDQEPDVLLAAPVDQAVRVPDVPAHPLPVRCAEHGKAFPHYRCEESERWLDAWEERWLDALEGRTSEPGS